MQPEKHGRANPGKITYTKPTLKEFGSVSSLTQAGTGTVAEMGAQMNTMQRP